MEPFADSNCSIASNHRHAWLSLQDEHTLLAGSTRYRRDNTHILYWGTALTLSRSQGQGLRPARAPRRYIRLKQTTSRQATLHIGAIVPYQGRRDESLDPAPVETRTSSSGTTRLFGCRSPQAPLLNKGPKLHNAALQFRPAR